MTRIVLVNRFFHPDISATSVLLTDLAARLAAVGHDVHVVTSRRRYDRPSTRLPACERVHGVTVHRVRSTGFGRAGVLARLADWASFALAALVRLLVLVRPGDILLAKTDPPILPLVAAIVAMLRGAQRVNWLQDLYPEVAAASGLVRADGRLVRAVCAARDRALSSAATNVAIGERMAARLVARGVPPGRVRVIANWTDETRIHPIPTGDNPLRAEWGLAGRFVVGYCGNLGEAHDIETVLAAARLLRHRPDIAFLVAGGGSNHARLADAARCERLHGFVFRPYQPEGRLTLLLSLPDVHWLSLRPAFEGLIVPSKLYGIAAAGRPVIALGDPDGELARLVRRHDSGIAVAEGDAAGFAAAATRLAADDVARAAMGAAGRAMVTTHFSREAALGRWTALVDSLAPAPADIRGRRPALLSQVR